MSTGMQRGMHLSVVTALLFDCKMFTQPVERFHTVATRCFPPRQVTRMDS